MNTTQNINTNFRLIFKIYMSTGHWLSFIVTFKLAIIIIIITIIIIIFTTIIIFAIIVTFKLASFSHCGVKKKRSPLPAPW